MSDVVAALQAAVRRRTVAGPDKEPAEFDGLHTDLQAHFPRLFEVCEQVDLPDHALLLRWPGVASDRPMVLMAHQDVVPVNPRDEWTHPAYDGEVVDGVLWGRGTLDCKGSLIAICTAVEELVEEGRQPAQDVWLSFGSDEEVSGHTATAAVTALQERGVVPWCVLDEGGMAVSGAFPGLTEPLAVIGLTEKGVAELELVARADGGHASMPPRNGAPAKLARAILALERHPAPARLPEPAIAMLLRLAPHVSGPLGALVGRAGWLRRPLAQVFARLGPTTAAMTRTTYAITQLTGSPANNVLASTATAGVNVRVAIDETADEAVERVRTLVGDGIEVIVRTAYDPSPVADLGDAFALLERVTREVMPDVIPVPYVVMAATDARHFQRVWRNCYRFNPFRMSEAQRQSLHNVNEHLDVTSLLEGVRWYRALLLAL
ncbi:M20/M25/M40 family metallo-hydrolase [Flexivirga caeni]|uniref:M20/M25/M40 family metallo-hydrolase n=1 Tax=Flexivirga caeni TaxID=2294115 RepID=A0A3M9MFR7_9MICO|nr:M20/M25/M40 family metallo-hydrolase [Flexivirga caeni]RNI24392.1 M20/M25/M40 family metallo-hydrolase [Flexivirga caeni]